MSDKKFFALWMLVGITIVCFALSYVFVPEVLIVVRAVEVEKVAPEITSTVPETVEALPLPLLLDLVTVPEFTYDLPGDSAHYGLNSCGDFEVLPVADRNIFLGDALAGTDLDMLNPCVREYSAYVGEIVVTQCRLGDSLTEAFRRAVTYFHVNCDPGVPQWDLEPATPHTEFLGDIF